MTRSPDPDAASAASKRVGERRWPMALAVLTMDEPSTPRCPPAVSLVVALLVIARATNILPQ